MKLFSYHIDFTFIKLYLSKQIINTNGKKGRYLF